jgi:hypothetical protein
MSYVKPAPGYIDKARAQTILEKWNPILDFKSDTVKPITDEHTRFTTAMLLENQENWCINEAANTAGGGGVFGASSASSSSQFSGDRYAPGDARLPKVLIPMIRRTFPELITNEIVGVQPMSGPVGLAFALRYRYESDPLGGPVNPNPFTNPAAGASGPGTWLGGNDSAAGVTLNPASNRATPYRFPSTINHTVGGTTLSLKVVGVTDNATALTSFAGINAGECLLAWDSGKLFTNSGDQGEFKEPEIGYQDLNTRFTGVSSSFFQSAVDPTTGLTEFEMLESDNGVGELLSAFELSSNIPQLTLEFAKTSVDATTRRLAARWSIELEQDLRNMNGLDVDNELTNAMSYEIQAEIDREMIMRMIQVTLTKGKGAGFSFWNAAKADGRWLGERNRDFYAKIVVEANRIAVRNRRGTANFIIATPRVCAILEMLPEFQWMPMNSSVNTQPVGIAKVGSVGGRFQVYRDTRTEAQKGALYGGSGNRRADFEYALLGYKGSEYYDTGIVYCPYIPVMIQRTIGPNDFSPRVGLLTRYGVVDNLFGADLYYHTIIVKGLSNPLDPTGPNSGEFNPGDNGVLYL